MTQATIYRHNGNIYTSVCTVDLKPCPFCGKAATIMFNASDEYRIGCQRCNIFQLDFTYNYEEAVQQWNNRESDIIYEN